MSESRVLLIFVVFCILAIFAGGGNVTAQEPKFRVNSFIPEKFVDKRLELEGGMVLGSNNSTGSRESVEDYHMVGHDENDEDIGGANGLGTFDYRYETVPRFLLLYSSLSLDYGWFNDRSVSDRYDDYDGFDSSENETDVNQYAIRLSASAEGGHYVKSDFFVSLLGGFQSNYIREPHTDLYSYDKNIRNYEPEYSFIREEEVEEPGVRRREDKYYRLDFTASAGWGRLYEGAYASTAIYMIDELRSNNLIEREPSYAEMLELSDLIYQYRMKHVIDKRIRRIEALSDVGVFLKNKGIVGDFAVSGQLLLQDVWDYFPSYSRLFGFRASLGFGYTYSYTGYQNTEESSRRRFLVTYAVDSLGPVDTLINERIQHHHYGYTRVTENSPHLRLVLEYHRPINHHWQADLYLTGFYYLDANSTVLTKDIAYQPEVSYELSQTKGEYSDYYEIGSFLNVNYIMNSRSNLLFKFYYQIPSHYKVKIKSMVGDTVLILPGHTVTEENSGHRYSFGATLNYRISIPTTLTIQAAYYGNSSELKSAPKNRESDQCTWELRTSIHHFVF